MPTVNDILDRFERDHLPTLEPGTGKDYARHIKVWRQVFGPKEAEKLVAGDFDEFMNVAKGKMLRNRMLATLSSAFSQAVTWGWLTNNVCLVVERHEQKGRDRYVTTDEFERFKAFMSRRGRAKRLCLAMDLALATGMTQGEIRNLRWVDVNSAARTICYQQSRPRRQATIPITPRVRSLLDQCWSLPNRRAHVLGQREGNPYTSDGIRAVFQRAMQKWQRNGVRREKAALSSG